MAEIRAFHALRYDLEKAGRIEELTCPPYDIISEEQREEFLARNPRNVIRLELPKGRGPLWGSCPDPEPVDGGGYFEDGHGPGAVHL